MSATHAAQRALAPAKINLGLFVGPRREHDDRHELVSVMQSVSLADEVTLSLAPEDRGQKDELICPDVPAGAEENLAAVALRSFRERTAWRSPPLRLRVEKRIPIAAGLGGGSADAAATLRLAAHMSGLGDEALLRELAVELGADVPAQLAPGRWLAGGAGESLEALPNPTPAFAALVLAMSTGLSTAAVYAEADRLGPARTSEELDRRREALRAALAAGAPLPGERDLLHNDLEGAALSLCPAIASTLAQAAATGADAVLVSGSGPTVLALFAPSGADAAGALSRARAAMDALGRREPPPVLATPVGQDFGCPGAAGEGDDATVRNNPRQQT